MHRLKQRINDYWSERAPSFQKQRWHELCSDKKDRWYAEFRRYIPNDRTLRILDLGTGTGFFAFLLAQEGHQVTGIDLSEEMILRARSCAENLDVQADFAVMDAEDPSFAPGSFDVLITRNLTWTLPHLEKAYQSWYQLLDKGGLLLNFDADYCRAVAEDTQSDLPDNHAHRELSDQQLQENDLISMELYAYQQPRPEWDVGLLLQAGFRRITLDTGVWERIYAEKDEFYNPVPIFTIAAYKDI